MIHNFTFLCFHLALIASTASTVIFQEAPMQGGKYTGSTGAFTQESWKEIQTVDDVVRAHPERMKDLLAALDFQQKGLADAAAALQKRDTVAALEHVIEHFRARAGTHWLLKGQPESVEASTGGVAHQLLQDTVTFDNVSARVPLRHDGGWEWTFTGPHGDQEFGYSLNGHQYLMALVTAWKQSGDKRYVEAFDRIIRDWIVHNPIPKENDSIYLVLRGRSKLDYRDIKEVRWRTLEAGNRLGVSWPYAFLEFQSSEAFSPAARLLMLASLNEHARYLMNYHKEGHNWTTMEMNGLALTGLSFPEFTDAEDWVSYALGVMKKEIYRQVYPDGVQTEISTKTQWVALRRFESVADYLQRAGRTISADYMQRVEDMYNYLAYAMRPDGHQPLNNDADREDLRPRVMAAARKFDRPDWLWIASNGKEGTRPQSLPSLVFPWAGIHVMRNGWDEQSHWAFFDTGPFGTGHQHADMLHLSVSAFGRDLLVDGGRYTHENYFSFDPTIWRGYFRSSFSHNVILVDGKGQMGGPLTTDRPLREYADFQITPEFHFARGTFSNNYVGIDGVAKHTRAVLYLTDLMWIVVDRLETDRPRKLETLWHFSPETIVALRNTAAVTINPGEGNLRIIPLGANTKPRLVKGQTTPIIQGWYSSEYGKKEPNPTVIYDLEIEGTSMFAWVLIPAKGDVPDPNVAITSSDEDARMGISVGPVDGKTFFITIPVVSGTPVIRQDSDTQNK